MTFATIVSYETTLQPSGRPARRVLQSFHRRAISLRKDTL